MIRSEIIKEAIREDINGIIITLAYTGKEDDLIRDIIKIVERNKGRVFLIKLDCDFSELKKRISNKSRQEFGKIMKLNDLALWFKKYDSERIYPSKRSLIINTEKLSPKQITKRILKEIKYKLT